MQTVVSVCPAVTHVVETQRAVLVPASSTCNHHYA
jgi:hypothetical protein